MEITTSVMQDIRVRNLFPATGAFFMELGCGAGNSLDEVSGHFRRTVGVDISRRRLSERKVPPADWEFVLSDLNAMLPFDSNSADAVLANQVIEHIVDPNFFAREIYRVLKGKGVVVVTTPNFRYVKHLYRIVVLGRGPKTANDDTRDGPWDDGHLHYFSHRDLSEIFSRAGFSKVRSRALIDLNGRHGTVRQLLDAFADSFLVREFLSGNALLVAQKQCARIDEVKRPAVIYWNNIPSPYFVGRLNALAGRGNIDLSAWFNRRREPDRSWNVDEGSFEFRYSYLSDRRNSLDLFRKLKHESPDVLVSLYNTPQFVAVSLWASALGIRTAYRVLPTFDAWVTRSIFKEFIKHAIFRFVDGVKVPGPDGARTAERYGVPASRIFPVTQSIDVRHFASARELGTAERLRIRESLGLRGCVFLYVGRLWAGKGLDYLLQAYQTVSAKCQDVSLLIVGDGVDEARFRTAAQGLPRVAFAGYVQVEELARYYAASDAMVFPTLGDPHGLVVEEAMAAGLPVISSNAAGDIRARVPEGKAGYVVEAGNAEALGERMIRLAENPALRMAMGSKAHEQVSALTHEKWADDFERFVGCLLAMSKRRVLI